MSILYLHGFCASLNGRKASFLRSHFGEASVVEPPAPGFPYCKDLTKPILQQLGNRFKREPRALLGLLGPNRIATLTRLSPEHQGFFSRSVKIAQELYDRVRPDIIVGSSLGGGVAMAIDSKETPMVLIGPVWNRKVKAGISSDSLPDAGTFTRVALAIVTANMRHPIARFGGFEVPPTIKPQTIILHSAYDEVFDLSNSATLLRNNPISLDEATGKRMNRVIEGLAAAGYGKLPAGRQGANDGRLVVIGKNHHTNEADPHDRINKNPHPHHALVAAVRLLLEEFGSSRVNAD